MWNGYLKKSKTKHITQDETPIQRPRPPVTACPLLGKYGIEGFLKLRLEGQVWMIGNEKTAVVYLNVKLHLIPKKKMFQESPIK